MKRHPDPPRALKILVTKMKGPWMRIHASGRDALFFGRKLAPGDNRFDAPAGQYGVLYVGRDAHCAFVETFLHETGIRFVTSSELARRTLSLVQSKRPLRLVDLRGSGLARMGADAALFSSTDYGLTQKWSLAIHDHPRKPDGILYRARHDPARSAVAVFERARSELTTRAVGSLADHGLAERLANILDTYDVGLI